MSERTFDLLGLVWMSLAVGSFAALWGRPAHYGRYAPVRRRGMVPARVAWALMESPALLVFAAAWLLAERRPGSAGILLGVLWVAHYADRAWLFPLRLVPSRRPMPLELLLCGAGFNVVNAAFNSAQLFRFGDGYADGWLRDPRLVVGVGLFVLGAAVNRRADAALAGLAARPVGSPVAAEGGRAVVAADSGYSIPRGGLFERVSCPNYLGEILQWCGWAIATWSLAGLSFALWTTANLVPRARAHHRWYRERFADYPPARRALVPGVW